MTSDFQARIAEIDEYAVELRALIPDTLNAFGGLARSAQTAGALDKKSKELLALAISVAMVASAITRAARIAQAQAGKKSRKRLVSPFKWAEDRA